MYETVALLCCPVLINHGSNTSSLKRSWGILMSLGRFRKKDEFVTSVWLKYAKFEFKNEEIYRARNVYLRAIKNRVKNDNNDDDGLEQLLIAFTEFKEEKAILLEEWLNMESYFGELGDVSLVQAMLPRIKRQRQVAFEDSLAENEEYVDYIFPIESRA
ncbi:hypothetical protein RCOM_0816780 [Ricinus communis]|uniref:Crooked neck protein n=1 Tax=Ricinus communis TaxID=3988 RepID=B9RX27_RICCO|nr:hypothetical protein RCOM_0816780 [Ricinus communis]